MSDMELSKLKFEAVQALYRLVKVLPDSAERAEAQAQADLWQARANAPWARAIAAKRSQVQA